MKPRFDESKAIQALDYFASRANGRKITKLVVLKLVYLADRYHLRKYGRTVLGDEYRAMKYGPVAVHTKKLIERMAETGGDSGGFLAVENIPGDRIAIRPLLTPDVREFSETDVEAMDCALKQLFLHDSIVAFTHLFPEWKKHEAALERGAPSVRMDYLDFFLPCGVPGAEYCDASENLVAMSRQDYQEDLAWSL